MVSHLKTYEGNDAKNQYVIKFNGNIIFQSYNSIIYVKLHDGTCFKGPNWNYSNTTTKYLDKFLREYKLSKDVLEVSEVEIKDKLCM